MTILKKLCCSLSCFIKDGKNHDIKKQEKSLLEESIVVNDVDAAADADADADADVVHDVDVDTDVVDTTTKTSKTDILDHVLEYHKTTYAEFYSIRRNPIKTNFNNETFINLCEKFDFETEDDLFIVLGKYNQEQKTDVTKLQELSEKRLQKCIKSDFFLFI
jgi:hypothetical protein